ETQKLLLDKIELYLDFLQSQECKDEFGELSQAQKLVVLCCYEKPDAVMLALFPRIAVWVRDSGATFEVRYGWPGRRQVRWRQDFWAAPVIPARARRAALGGHSESAATC